MPWSKLGWEPILIALEDVTLLAGPHEESEVLNVLISHVESNRSHLMTITVLLKFIFDFVILKSIL